MVNTKTIINLLMSIVFMVVLLSVAAQLIPVGAEAFYDMTQSMTNTTILGAGPVAFAEITPALLGWFWVLGPFILVIMIVIGIFLKKRGR